MGGSAVLVEKDGIGNSKHPIHRTMLRYDTSMRFFAFRSGVDAVLRYAYNVYGVNTTTFPISS